MTTAVLPEGWQERLVPIRNDNTRGATGWCLDVHDLCVSKLVAGRDKDRRFVVAALEERLVDPGVLARAVGERLERYTAEARSKSTPTESD